METIYTSEQTDVLNQLLAQSYADSHIHKVHIHLTDTQMLNSFTTPILAVSTPGMGYAIRVIKASIAMYASAFQPYFTHLQMALYTNPTYPQVATIATFLDNAGAATDSHQFFYPVVAADGEANPIAGNAPLYIQTLVGNPTTGDSPIDIYISYEIVEVVQL